MSTATAVRQVLPPIPWNPPTPDSDMRAGCDIEELGNGDAAWALWDAAVRAQDAQGGAP